MIQNLFLEQLQPNVLNIIIWGGPDVVFEMVIILKVGFYSCLFQGCYRGNNEALESFFGGNLCSTQ